MTERQRIEIETTAEGLEPGDVVIIEWTYDDEEFELIVSRADEPISPT